MAKRRLEMVLVRSLREISIICFPSLFVLTGNFWRAEPQESSTEVAVVLSAR